MALQATVLWNQTAVVSETPAISDTIKPHPCFNISCTCALYRSGTNVISTTARAIASFRTTKLNSNSKRWILCCYMPTLAVRVKVMKTRYRSLLLNCEDKRFSQIFPLAGWYMQGESCRPAFCLQASGVGMLMLFVQLIFRMQLRHTHWTSAMKQVHSCEMVNKRKQSCYQRNQKRLAPAIECVQTDGQGSLQDQLEFLLIPLQPSNQPL